MVYILSDYHVHRWSFEDLFLNTQITPNSRTSTTQRIDSRFCMRRNFTSLKELKRSEAINLAHYHKQAGNTQVGRYCTPQHDFLHIRGERGMEMHSTGRLSALCQELP